MGTLSSSSGDFVIVLSGGDLQRVWMEMYQSGGNVCCSLNRRQIGSVWLRVILREFLLLRLRSVSPDSGGGLSAEHQHI